MILGVLGGRTELENCVFQCDTTGITVKKSAELVMRYCDLYGAKVRLPLIFTETCILGIHISLTMYGAFYTLYIYISSCPQGHTV